MSFTVNPTMNDIPRLLIMLIHKFGHFIPLLVVGTLVIAAVLMLLWNYVMPQVLGLKKITYWQALALLIISLILFK